MSKGRFDFAPPNIKVSWACLIQLGEAENYFIQTHCSKPVPIGQSI